MKNLILLFTFLSIFTFGQVENFDIINDKIKWEKIFYTKDSFENIIQELKEESSFENVQVDENTITLNFKDLLIDYKGAGKPFMSVTEYLESGLFFGKAVIEYKENRYKVTVTDIKYQYKPSGMRVMPIKLNPLENKVFSMNTKSFSSRFRKDAYLVNFTFTNLFNTKNTFENKEW